MLDGLSQAQSPADGSARRARRPRRPWVLPERHDRNETFHAPPWRVVVRLAQWLRAAADYGRRRLRAWRLGQSSAVENGVLLRETLERMGGTFVKLGQQLSTRLDLLPFETCEELAKMLDRMPAFPTEQAIAAIERATGRPLAQTFSAFDPEPLGAASIGCVYHAFLRSGEEVAVKVRRPGVGELFAADLTALDLLGGLAEFLTLLRPGMTRALRAELRTMLLEELDFRSEARFQELFRRRAKKDRQHVSAPRVYQDYGNHDVMVSEFVRGVWVQDLLAAKESGDEEALDYCARLGITPEKVARRLLHTLYWSNFESSFYHADPHPANILVRPGSELMMIDFGAVGPTTHRNRRNYAQLFRHQGRRDIDGMVQVFSNIVSPLPPVDINALYKEGERLTANWQYGFESKHSEWWERSSAGMWIGMLEMTRSFHIPINIDTVRLVRSSLLYDTIAARLDHTINMQAEFESYRSAAEQRLGQRGLRQSEEEFEHGRPLLEIDRAARFGQRLSYQLHNLAAAPLFSPLPGVRKSAVLLSETLSWGAAVAAVTVAATLVAWTATPEVAGPSGMLGALNRVTAGPLFWGIVLALTARSCRAMRIAIGELDPEPTEVPPLFVMAQRLSAALRRR